MCVYARVYVGVHACGVHACVLHVYTPVKTWVEKHAHQGGSGPRHRAWLSWCGFSAWPRQSKRTGFPQYHCPPGARRWQPPRVSALLLPVRTQPLTPAPCWEGDPGSRPDHLRPQNKWQRETQTRISQSNKTHLFQTGELPGSPRSCLVCSCIAYSALLTVDTQHLAGLRPRRSQNRPPPAPAPGRTVWWGPQGAQVAGHRPRRQRQGRSGPGSGRGGVRG